MEDENNKTILELKELQDDIERDLAAMIGAKIRLKNYIISVYCF